MGLKNVRAYRYTSLLNIFIYFQTGIEEPVKKGTGN